MRTDILPLCDKHFRTMEACIAPYSPDYSIDFFRCTEKFCGRCFGERVGYVTPKRNQPPVMNPVHAAGYIHGCRMVIIRLDRRRNHITYSCTEPDCYQRVMRT